MNWLVDTLKEIWNWIQSLEGVSTVSFGSIITFIITIIMKNRSSLKMNAKYNSLSSEYKQYQELVESEKELYTKQLKQYQVIVDDLYDLAIGLRDNASAQTEAMNEAFKNSNLNASAKKLIEGILKPTTKTNVEEVELINLSQLVNSPVQEQKAEEENQNVEVQDEAKIYRVK